MSFFRQFPKTQYDFGGRGIDTQIVDIFRFLKVEDKISDDLTTYQYYQIQNGDRPDIVSNELYGTPDYWWTFFMVNEQLKTGLSGWPMAVEEFEAYIETEYAGTIINTRPEIVYRSDDTISEYRNSLADRFLVGEQINGVISGANGLYFSKDPQLSQLLIKDVEGSFQDGEAVLGQQSDDTVTAYKVFPYANAPHHYVNSEGLISYNALFINEQNSAEGVQNDTSDPDLTVVTNLEYETELNEARADIRVIRPELIAGFARSFEELLKK